MFAAILPCVSYDQTKQNIREVAKQVNQVYIILVKYDVKYVLGNNDEPVLYTFPEFSKTR